MRKPGKSCTLEDFLEKHAQAWKNVRYRADFLEKRAQSWKSVRYGSSFWKNVRNKSAFRGKLKNAKIYYII